ncbi:TPM domain-containing protein, partial [Corallococcus soli]
MVKAVLLSLLLPTLLLGTVPSITRPVTDETGSLGAQEMETVARALVKLRTERQVQMAVVLVDTTNGRPIEDYAEEVFRAWKGGEAGRDNGLLLVIAKGDRRSRLEVGYGLEPSLTDGESQALLHAQGPLLREGRIADALVGIIAAVREQLPGEGAVSPPLGEWLPSDVRAFFFFLVVTAFVTAGLLVQCRMMSARDAGLPAVVVALLALLPPALLVSVAWSSQLTFVEVLLPYAVMLALCLCGWSFARKKAAGTKEAAAGILGGVSLAAMLLGALVGVLWPAFPSGMVGVLWWVALLSFPMFMSLGFVVLLAKGGGGGGGGHS